jgi:hypothetical protein
MIFTHVFHRVLLWRTEASVGKWDAHAKSNWHLRGTASGAKLLSFTRVNLQSFHDVASGRRSWCLLVDLALLLASSG